VLNRSQVGVETNFFDLGGHSLLATKIVARAAKLFKVRIPLRRFFEHPTIRAFAAWLIVSESKPGITDAIASALLRISAMTPEERQQHRDAAAARNANQGTT
jgi:hypothetical protein